uniref:FTH domain-containing protein n=1 Tax=Caenorhabditis tropicalis TaxID=1561998 RepID=A0A1I7T935_9PELO
MRKGKQVTDSFDICRLGRLLIKERNDVASIHMELAIESDCTELKLSHLNGKPIFKSKTFEKVKSDFKKIVIQIVENPEATVKTFSISASGKEEKLKEIFEASAGYKLKVETITWFLGGFTKEDFQMFSAVFDMKHLKTIRFKMPGEGLGWLMDELNDVNKCLMFVDKSRKNKEWKYLMNLENLDFVKDVIERLGLGRLSSIACHNLAL